MNVEKEIVIIIKEIENGMMVFKRIIDFYKEYINKTDANSRETKDAIGIKSIFYKKNSNYSFLQFKKIFRHFAIS